MFFLSCVCYAFVRVCLYICALWSPAGKGWPLGSLLWCLTVSLSLSHWYPVSGVVLDCIDSWSLHPYLLLKKKINRRQKSWKLKMDWTISWMVRYSSGIITIWQHCYFHICTISVPVSVLPYSLVNMKIYGIFSLSWFLCCFIFQSKYLRLIFSLLFGEEWR